MISSAQQEGPRNPNYHFRYSFERGDCPRRTMMNVDTMGTEETLRCIRKVEELKPRN